MRVLVTGASGHVGGAIAAGLVAAGHDVVGLSRRPAAPEGVTVVSADIGDSAWPTFVATQVAPCEAIVHAAACLDKDPLAPALVRINGHGTQNVLAVAEAFGARVVVYISGVPVIGTPLDHPISEDHPTHPLTTYHATKLLGEHLVAVASPGGTRSCSLRLTSPVGPGMPPGRILSHFVGEALAGRPLVLSGHGSRRQDYVDVRDVADAVGAALGADAATGVINVASGQPVANVELARRCVEALRSSSQVEFSGSPDPEDGVTWDVSITRAAARLDWRPTRTLEASISAVAEECRASD